MIVTESLRDEDLFIARATKSRADSTSSVDTTVGAENHSIRNLELEGVKEIFQDYDLLETAEAVACVICGKNYKSKVCVKKHLWEHSVYWDLFDGLKKQQRVLSIQAAIILAIKFNPSLSRLLVTQPSNSNKRKVDKLHEPSTIVDKNINSSTTTKTLSLNNVKEKNYDTKSVRFESTRSILEPDISPIKKRKVTHFKPPSPFEEKSSIDFLTNLSVRNESLERNF